MTDNPTKAALEVKIVPGQVISFKYKNWKGIVGYRKAKFDALIYADNEWHHTKQWLVRAFDIEKGEIRIFALQDMVPTDCD